MILDTLENVGLYETIHPRFKQAFDFLRKTDLASLPYGKIELDGSNLFVNVAEITGKTAEVARLETHKRYIDIQVPVNASETIVSRLVAFVVNANDFSYLTDLSDGRPTRMSEMDPGEHGCLRPGTTSAPYGTGERKIEANCRVVAKPNKIYRTKWRIA